MRGGINYQVNQIFINSGIFTPGLSKHSEKIIARENGAKTWKELGKELNIYSYSSAETYKKVWHDFAQWSKSTGLKDIIQVKAEHIKGYLETRIADGIKYSTFEKECSALTKFESALNMYCEKSNLSNNYNFGSVINETKNEAKEVLDRSLQSRAYENPKILIENIRNEKYKTIASIQYEGGARINEVWRIEQEDLKGLREDPFSGEIKGWIKVEGKGGKEREIFVSEKTYIQIQNFLSKEENLHFDKDEYREALRDAANISEQDYTGSHGLRWNFAQDRMEELSEKTDMTYEEKLQEVSWEMGHERADITEHYLGK